ncbi:hypothetical protein GZ77_02995 [Endozoicomonas montiporae]|uniref:Beta-hexosaminidase n=2 Tax=Endozoicomonas montiporae TaxID=1027273 RepID=A0A081NAW8_9GAMM|nr:beta-N-acetylhexosaminidase [Endozoicomonas montiporae]AMO56709.1 beta-N-acetylhexosaminidase [Endozoicomonas montiporae CL-33]KEQ15591.1 hypothetical protein GZ77_02995 [Endozoicomonas montiporae]
MERSSQQGHLIVDLKGTELSSADRDFLVHEGIAGVLLFTRNYSSREQLQALVQDIRQLRPDLLIMVDHEGGRVQRFKDGFVRLPAAGQLSRYYLQDPQGALKLARDVGWLMASELRAVGIDLSLAPVLDLDLGKTDVVGDRAFGSEPEQVIQMTSAWIEGVREAGMACVLKHFPGHGSVDADSHLLLPEDHRPFDEIAARDMVPFKELIQQGADAVIPAHIVFTEVDSRPAGFSRVWLQDILRDQLGFEGIVISDCLTMEGAASVGSFSNRVEQALSAGCDLLILSSRTGAIEALSNLPRLSQREVDISTLRASNAVGYEDLIASERYFSCKDRIDYLRERYN